MEKIQIKDLDKAISTELKIYSTEVSNGMKAVNDRCMKEFTENTRRDAPKGLRKKYYRNITSETIKDTPNMRVNVWYVKDPEYRLTHLIKNGHATRNGGRTKGQDFISDNYNQLEKKFDNGIREVIKNGH